MISNLLLTYLFKFNDCWSSSNYSVSSGRIIVSSGVESVWKEAVVAWLNVCLDLFGIDLYLSNISKSSFCFTIKTLLHFEDELINRTTGLIDVCCRIMIKNITALCLDRRVASCYSKRYIWYLYIGFGVETWRKTADWKT